MLQLSFNQKVGFGFAIIIVLLLISGLSSLWNLNGINDSSSRVNETAVPVVKESNEVQIQLLKQAKLSTLAFNAVSEAEIVEFKKDFSHAAEKFYDLFISLQDLAKKDAEMTRMVKEVKEHYDLYVAEVDKMFAAKLEFIVLGNKADDAADNLINYADEVGASILDLTYNLPGDAAEADIEMVEGVANQSDGYLLSVIQTITDTKKTTSLDGLEETSSQLVYTVNNLRNAMDQIGSTVQSYDESMWNLYEENLNLLYQQLDIKPGMAEFKLEQLEKAKLAREKLDTATNSVGLAVDGLDTLLKAADDQFNTLQEEVSANLDFGFKSSIVMLIVLIVLAAQNFNSMRMAIKRKMIDLAKLNGIGRSLAEMQSQNTALEVVLKNMQEKVGVSRGSVFLTNENNEFEVKAFFPPKNIDPDAKPIRFNMGEGVLGQAAESKQVTFVPNTAKDKNFVTKEGDQPQALLCVPLVDNDVLVGVINLSGEVDKVTFADSDYEFVSSVARSLVTTIKNIRMREVIEEHNRNLEAKVEERTAALRQKNRDIASMMSNMHQGLYTITLGGLIHEEYSAYLEQIFETDRIANRNFADLMFENTTLTADAIDQATTAVDAIVGEDEMMFEFNSHCLPAEMTVNLDGDRSKILEMDWDPIINDGEVEKLMVTVRDVTELKALEAEAAGQKQELEIIGEILAVDANKFNDFLDTSFDFVQECQGIIEDTPSKNQDVIATLFRNMHTVKGNARTYGLSLITDKVHLVEHTYDELRKNEELEWDPSILLNELSTAKETIEKYSYVFKDKLGRDAEQGGNIYLDMDRVSELLKDIQSLTTSELPPKVQKVVQDAYTTLVSVDSKPMSSVIQDVITSVQSLANDLGKPEPNITINDGGIFIKGEAHSMLNNIFMHVFRNGLDHGIEGPEERASKGKPETGGITMDVTYEGDMAKMKVYDDGRGIALTKIYEKAVEGGTFEAGAPRPADAEIANLIFASGFSTAEEVTNISGRGVGMDAVKNFLISKGGAIEVVLDAGEEGADFRTFSTIITLPEEFFSVAPDIAESA